MNVFWSTWKKQVYKFALVVGPISKSRGLLQLHLSIGTCICVCVHVCMHVCVHVCVCVACVRACVCVRDVYRACIYMYDEVAIGADKL